MDVISEVRSLSIAELSEHLEETETHVRRFSEELVQQLALRDELGFEKEVKNSFISTLIDVQSRQKEQRELRRRKKRTPRGGAGPGKSPASVSLPFERRTRRVPPLLLVPEPLLLGASPPQRFSVEALSSAIHSGFRQTFGSSCSERQVMLSAEPRLPQK